MKCPVCRETDLVIAERQGIEIDYCRQCRGVWLDRGELDKIIERTAPLTSAPVAGATRPELPVERLEYLRETEAPATYPPARERPRDDYSESRRRHRRDDDDDDDDDDYKYRRRRKRGGWLEELFDFD